MLNKLLYPKDSYLGYPVVTKGVLTWDTWEYWKVVGQCDQDDITWIYLWVETKDGWKSVSGFTTKEYAKEWRNILNGQA